MIDLTDQVDLYLNESSDEELKLSLAKIVRELSSRGVNIDID